MITDLYASDSLIKPCVHIKQSLSEHQDFHVFDLMIFWGKSFWGESFWGESFCCVALNRTSHRRKLTRTSTKGLGQVLLNFLRPKNSHPKNSHPKRSLDQRRENPGAQIVTV